MRARQLTFSRGATINTGSYNSERVDVSLTVELEDDDIKEEVFLTMRSWVKARVAEEVGEIKEKYR